MVRWLWRGHRDGQSAVVQSCGVQLGRFHRDIQTAIRGTSAGDWVWQVENQPCLFASVCLRERSEKHKRRKILRSSLPTNLKTKQLSYLSSLYWFCDKFTRYSKTGTLHRAAFSLSYANYFIRRLVLGLLYQYLQVVGEILKIVVVLLPFNTVSSISLRQHCTERSGS